MRELIILGAGPHAQEMAAIVAQVNAQSPTWELLGFIVPEGQDEIVGRETPSGDRVLGTYEKLERYPGAYVALEYGSRAPSLPRERIVSLVAPTAFIAPTAKMGAGCVIYPGCFVGHNAVLGNRVFVLGGAIINHDDDLADDVTVCSNASLAGFVRVEAGSYLGQACTIRQYVRIGRGSLIGMGAVVLEDVAPNSVMVGNPARKLRDRE
jgi:sugar O-acyltransferase (sialic acid O-acetyltransferase NeuD family)